MLPLTVAARVRHRRELTTAQQVRRALVLLFALAVVAAIGVRGNAFAGRPLLKFLDESTGTTTLAVAGWAAVALPFAAVFLLASPIRSRLIRLAATIILAAALLALDPYSTKHPLAAIGRAATNTTSLVVLTGVIAWAATCSIAFALARPADHHALLAKVRRSVTWVGPAILTTSLVCALVLTR